MPAGPEIATASSPRHAGLEGLPRNPIPQWPMQVSAATPRRPPRIAACYVSVTTANAGVQVAAIGSRALDARVRGHDDKDTTAFTPPSPDTAARPLPATPESAPATTCPTSISCHRPIRASAATPEVTSGFFLLHRPAGPYLCSRWPSVGERSDRRELPCLSVVSLRARPRGDSPCWK